MTHHSHRGWNQNAKITKTVESRITPFTLTPSGCRWATQAEVRGSAPLSTTKYYEERDINEEGPAKVHYLASCGCCENCVILLHPAQVCRQNAEIY